MKTIEGEPASLAAGSAQWYPHDLFDADYYVRQFPASANDPVAHFQEEGDARGADPSPYFSTTFYKQAYPDWSSRGARTALEDFLFCLELGYQRQPHPLIDPAYYLEQHEDLTDIGDDAVMHFVRHGDEERRRPSAGFDAVFYADCYLPLGAGNPLKHFVVEGSRKGYLPLPASQTRQQSASLAGELTVHLKRPIILGVHDAQRGGVPILALDLARALRSRGWDPVFALVRAGPLLEQFRSLGPTLILAEGWDRDGWQAGLPAEAPMIITTAAAAQLAIGSHRSLVLINEMPDYVRENGFVANLCRARDAGAKLVVSFERMARTLEPELGHVHTLLVGMLTLAFTLAGARAVRRQVRNGSGPVFIGAGYADRRKGFDLFLEAARMLAVERPSAHFVWLGDVDGWARQLADQAVADGLRLMLPGFVENSIDWYINADVYLLTSRQDPGPTTAANAAAMGKPVVAYDTDIGMRDAIADHAAFVKPGHVDEFVKTALDRVGETAGQRRYRRRQVRSLTSFDTYVDALLELLTARSADA